MVIRIISKNNNTLPCFDCNRLDEFGKVDKVICAALSLINCIQPLIISRTPHPRCKLYRCGPCFLFFSLCSALLYFVLLCSAQLCFALFSFVLFCSRLQVAATLAPHCLAAPADPVSVWILWSFWIFCVFWMFLDFFRLLYHLKTECSTTSPVVLIRHPSWCKHCH